MHGSRVQPKLQVDGSNRPWHSESHIHDASTGAGGDNWIYHDKNPLIFLTFLNFPGPIISTRTRISTPQPAWRRSELETCNCQDNTPQQKDGRHARCPTPRNASLGPCTTVQWKCFGEMIWGCNTHPYTPFATGGEPPQSFGTIKGV
jgi:hypothetical protein